MIDFLLTALCLFAIWLLAGGPDRYLFPFRQAARRHDETEPAHHHPGLAFLADPDESSAEN